MYTAVVVFFKYLPWILNIMDENWKPAADEELLALKKLVCSQDFGGMEDFSKERSHILRLAYICLRTTKLDFGECQKRSWDEYRNMMKKECKEEL